MTRTAADIVVPRTGPCARTHAGLAPERVVSPAHRQQRRPRRSDHCSFVLGLVQRRRGRFPRRTGRSRRALIHGHPRRLRTAEASCSRSAQVRKIMSTACKGATGRIGAGTKRRYRGLLRRFELASADASGGAEYERSRVLVWRRAGEQRSPSPRGRCRQPQVLAVTELRRRPRLPARGPEARSAESAGS